MISLDGVMQAPGGPQEDTSGNFKFGGWTAPFGDEAYAEAVRKELSQPTDYLLGRKTFEIWENYWPEHGDFWPGINSGTKFVLSKSRKASNWEPSEFVQNVSEIEKIKKSIGNDIQVWGSSELVQLLLEHDLVDEIRLKIHPILLGNGKNLFSSEAFPSAFELTESVVTPKGVIIATYQKSGKVQTGDHTKD